MTTVPSEFRRFVPQLLHMITLPVFFFIFMLVYQPMMGAVVCEIALVEVTNSSDVETVKGMMQARIDAQVDGGAWYPESIEGWKNNSRIVTNGNCVMMIAWQFCDDAVADFNALF